MNLKTSNLKIILGLVYIIILSIGFFYLFSIIDIKDLTSYELIRSNRETIMKYKCVNFIFLTLVFFIFCIFWVLLLGFAMPLLIFAGFVFGKWWGILIVVISTTIGATLLYIMARYFFKEMIEKNLAPKFYKLKEFFNKNDIVYFMSYRFVGGGGTPFAIQNILPVLFNMPIKNYFIATLIGSTPSMFVTVALGSGLESIIDQNEQISFFNIVKSPDIYLPIVGFFVLLLIAFFIKKFFFKSSSQSL